MKKKEFLKKEFVKARLLDCIFFMCLVPLSALGNSHSLGKENDISLGEMKKEAKVTSLYGYDGTKGSCYSFLKEFSGFYHVYGIEKGESLDISKKPDKHVVISLKREHKKEESEKNTQKNQDDLSNEIYSFFVTPLISKDFENQTYVSNLDEDILGFGEHPPYEQWWGFFSDQQECLINFHGTGFYGFQGERAHPLDETSSKEYYFKDFLFQNQDKIWVFVRYGLEQSA